ncbi:hypothetical protein CNR27_08950 [Luteimonas chenhongjianii]|uniref:Uncharacterized protein n=1 Tax=Luteimonas chenhongjianii TaxID=2006110 RepID=A0A290XF24_9GAMM|nr:hypothetical protein CNR27_08950 [Luteimonas chenhongjianii]RPD83651.1 hypothetical protein EGK76_14625 [Luteimonas sp. 100069]
MGVRPRHDLGQVAAGWPGKGRTAAGPDQAPVPGRPTMAETIAGSSFDGIHSFATARLQF